MARKTKSQVPSVNPELNGFDVRINEFGEIVSTYNVAKLNDFLDEHTDDKKFRGVAVVRRQDTAAN